MSQKLFAGVKTDSSMEEVDKTTWDNLKQLAAAVSYSVTDFVQKEGTAQVGETFITEAFVSCHSWLRPHLKTYLFKQSAYCPLITDHPPLVFCHAPPQELYPIRAGESETFQPSSSKPRDVLEGAPELGKQASTNNS
ncbi:hypothetical protein LIA77_04440 [Sarocladium implicatum]|nr:hypothetical protein LIA77_04440 [Sarocladium implicatum]